MSKRIVWQYWENSPEYPDGIGYINLCHRSVDIHSTDGKGYQVIRLNEKTIFDYLDDINPLIFNAGGNSCQLAQKADYFRAKLLNKYGGMWLDSDAVVVKSLDPIFDKLSTVDFYGYYIINPCIWSFACNPGTKVIQEWCRVNEDFVNKSKAQGLGKGELGHRNMRPIMDKYMDDPRVEFTPAGNVHPIDHRTFWKYLQPGNISRYVKPNQPFFMLNNALIDPYLKKLNEWEISTKNILMADLFRLSGVTINLVFISSVIKTVNSDLSYGPRSVFTTEQRYQQTLQTIDSVRKKIPNSKILLVECSDLEEKKEKTLINLVDHYVNLYEDKESREKIQSPYKQIGEGTMTIAAIDYASKIHYRNFIKISGRYSLSEKFDIKMFNNDLNVFRPVPEFDNIITTLYKLNKACTTKLKKFLIDKLEKMSAQGCGYETIIDVFRKTILVQTKNVKFIGVKGMCATNNKNSHK